MVPPGQGVPAGDSVSTPGEGRDKEECVVGVGACAEGSVDLGIPQVGFDWTLPD
jgi:hypothetical protein